LYIISYELHNERLCKLRIKGKYNNITLINAYAPTEDKTEEIKEQFYDDLQSMVHKVPKSDLTIILGDVNTKLGKEPAYQKITAKHMLFSFNTLNFISPGLNFFRLQKVPQYHFFGEH